MAAMTGRAVWRVGPGQWFARAATARTFGATAPPAAAPLPVHRALTSLHVAGSCSVDCSRAIAGRTPSAAVVGAAARGLKTPYPSVQFEPTAGVVTRGGSGTSLTPERLATEVSPLLARGGEAAVVVPPLPATRFSPEWSAVFAACEAERETAAGCGVTLRLDWTLPQVGRGLDEAGWELGSILKKRRRKMNRHKYQKWRKKMRSVLRKKK